ncbi:hypothetical protein KC332_g10319 [Hortaea werneckii]|uniref:Diaminohydroxyphosphoribosylamino-pyrimidine deaminase n=2 Tax=Hortaea werneckii TaxID=91943 RepID=A0A3M7HBH8_HORWE|nr:hypothetical protein KC358_g10943 [Hortaea werneckii]OTA31269.1 hypothetical protein BTJ68_09113 [Hortaea werneckii EXF-2000]KAI6818120.1 hypothetical protein KC350_g10412 [Hortaea werneckii]KAI6920729.1 hypothetical protein KC348_g10317 [Hortaea werneckii]KAI6930895.1 hypothetical protein KC341_g9930 [Hortaea werneckii]
MTLSEDIQITCGDKVTDAYEETFDLFSHDHTLSDLGMLDPKAHEIELTVGGQDFLVAQSPGALQSGRKEGTTGAAVWQSSVRASEWLAHAENVLFTSGLLTGDSLVLELGSGISALVPCILARRVRQVVATDQQHILKLLQQNIDKNLQTHQTGTRKKAAEDSQHRVQALALDWEEDDIPKQLSANDLGTGVDVVLACDTLYNYALIEPFVQTCVEICRSRQAHREQTASDTRPTACVIVQQLRQAEVFEQWLETSLRHFDVWRIPNGSLSDGLREGSGFAVHVCVLKM